VKKKRRVVFALITVGVAIALVSTTLGREIYAGRTPGLVSFGLIHFAGYLFFLLMPVEALVPIYQAEGHVDAVLVTIAVSTAIVAQAIDYGIGRAFSDRVIDEVIGVDRFERFRARIERWGGWAILVFNLFPLSSPNMLLVAGIVRYSARKAFLFSLVGLTAKYVGIVYLFDAVTWWTSRGS
jgi:membrane protein DedA with SNARE-associated domain